MTQSLRQVEEAFLAVLARRKAGAGHAFTDTQMDTICGFDAGVRAEVASLLRHADTGDDNASGFLNPAQLHGSRASVFNRDASLEEWGGSAIGQRIGDFVIIGQLGAGGMGVVYVAEQQRPRRIVALKLIRKTIATPSMIARFEREAQLLGRLSHPGIAQIYATGVADVIITGSDDPLRVPYIAMERVEGLSVLRHVQAAQCEPPAILQLVAQACDAIGHAHQRGVIHRDIKPANLLVAARGLEPRLKVLDFGVAKAVDSRAAENTLECVGHIRHHSLTHLTREDQLVGTPAFMSPEQVQPGSRAVDQRCDIFALGSILFLLLTGQHAIDLTDCSLPDAMRRIVEVEPLKLGAIAPQLRGDMETVTARAMEKDRDHRYQTAAELARDLRRVMAGQCIR